MEHNAIHNAILFQLSFPQRCGFSIDEGNSVILHKNIVRKYNSSFQFLPHYPVIWVEVLSIPSIEAGSLWTKDARMMELKKN